MLKQLIFGAALVLSTGQALAYDYHPRHGRVVTVEPSISFTLGEHHDGVGVRYHSGGTYYYDAPRYPVRVIGGPVYYSPRAYGHSYRHHGHRHHDRHDGHRGHRHHRD
jgi:hypothetical protein